MTTLDIHATNLDRLRAIHGITIDLCIAKGSPVATVNGKQSFAMWVKERHAPMATHSERHRLKNKLSQMLTID